jgi:hypothetical protein
MNGANAADDLVSHLVERHTRIGWWSLLAFITLGVVLEAFHGFKIGWYLDVSNETRRLMWTLAHAHGTLVSVVHLVYAATLPALQRTAPVGAPRLRATSACLLAATFLLPGGFFAGGIVVYGGDPGLGILLVPLGAAALIAAVLMTALQSSRRLQH